MVNRINNLVIADDDPDDIELFKSAVDEICPDIVLATATDGEKLMDHLYDSPIPDAIILDLNMPIKDGLQCLKEIRATPRFDEVPVIILSTSNTKGDRYTCLSAGANHYFFKPLTYTGLKDIVQRLCDGELVS